VKVTLQLPALRVLNFEPAFVQTFFDDLATVMDILALLDTLVSPAVSTKLLAEYVFLATTACGAIVNAGT
jgi:hypothetical protein